MRESIATLAICIPIGMSLGIGAWAIIEGEKFAAALSFFFVGFMIPLLIILSMEKIVSHLHP